MKIPRPALIPCFLLLILTAMPSYAVDIESSPGWLVLEKGKQLFDYGEFGEALYYFRQAREKLGEDAEVEYWIGRVFEAEGEHELAERQYIAALGGAQFLAVRDDVYDIRYRLADLYFTQGDFAGYESQLEAVIERDTQARAASGAVFLERRLLSTTLAERGLDKLLELYRLEDFGGLAGYYRLGVYKLRTGFIESATELLTYAFVISISTVINHAIEMDPEYRFTTFSELIGPALKSRAVQKYFEESQGFGQMYGLALSLRASEEAQKQEAALELLRLTRDYDPSGYWSGRARAQINSPFEEDFMIVF